MEAQKRTSQKTYLSKMPLPQKEVLTPMEAHSLWADHRESLGEAPPDRRKVYRWCEAFEGRLCYRTAKSKWAIYKDVWLQYIVTGFPDLEIRLPVMEIATGLRYVHKFGLPGNYRLRELRRDLNERDMVIKNPDPKVRDRVSRTSLNRFIAEWTGTQSAGNILQGV